jgi:multiple sugar transport system substrate-binding protein
MPKVRAGGLPEGLLIYARDYYKGSLYGYQTDGDTYVMFYNKPWLDNADEGKAFADKHGYALRCRRPGRSWTP